MIDKQAVVREIREIYPEARCEWAAGELYVEVPNRTPHVFSFSLRMPGVTQEKIVDHIVAALESA